MGMKQFGKKTPKAKPQSDNEIAISASKRFLKGLIDGEFFFGKERRFTPALRHQLDKAFQQFVSKNSRTRKAVWPLFIEHIMSFIEAAFIAKIKGNTFNWMEATMLLDGYKWADQP